MAEPTGTDQTHFGFTTVGWQDKQGLVDQVFTRVASRYDLMNDLMSGGLHRAWKDAAVTWLDPPRGSRPWHGLDVAGGTGDIALRILDRAGPASRVTVFDINADMLAEGRRKAAKAGKAHLLEFTQGNGEALPFADGSFDAYTIAFGLRNIRDIEAAVAEAYRVLKPGGRFLCLEFSEVDVPVFDKIYDLYSFNAIPVIGRLVAGDADAYQYLVESIRKFPNQESFAAIIRRCGFSRVAYRNLSGGIAAMHSGWRI